MTKPTVLEMLPRIKAYRDMPGNGVGGSLHIVLDDGNVDDSHVRFCMEAADEKGDHVGFEIASDLLRMSRTQRRKLSAMFYD